MFDVSFSELLVIAVVALIVIGPEKLPKVARTLGAISGRMQRYIAQVKEEVNRETRFEGLQTLQAEIQAGVEKSTQQAQVLEQQVASYMAIDKTPHQLPVDEAAPMDSLPELPTKKRAPRKKPSKSLAHDADVKQDLSEVTLQKLVKKRVKKTPS